jgi:hypothetical protein
MKQYRLLLCARTSIRTAAIWFIGHFAQVKTKQEGRICRTQLEGETLMFS